MYQRLKIRTSEILRVAPKGDFVSRAVTGFIVALITLNVLSVILETVKSLSTQYEAFFHNFELFSVIIFTIEYLLRLWTANMEEGYKHPIIGRGKWALTPLAMVDLLAILPFYLPVFIPLDLRFIRALRLFRLFRLLKMGRYSESMKTFGNVIKNKKEELFVTLFGLTILLVIASSLMYYFENAAQPEAFSSIPAAMWWGVATLTTVGYGDVYPITPIGKFLGAIIAILGIGMFALPAGILGSGFVEEMQKKRTKHRVCPHCGEDIEAPPEQAA
jgi:voltage-gated potassium channel